MGYIYDKYYVFECSYCGKEEAVKYFGSCNSAVTLDKPLAHPAYVSKCPCSPDGRHDYRKMGERVFAGETGSRFVTGYKLKSDIEAELEEERKAREAELEEADKAYEAKVAALKGRFGADLTETELFAKEQEWKDAEAKRREEAERKAKKKRQVIAGIEGAIAGAIIGAICGGIIGAICGDASDGASIGMMVLVPVGIIVNARSQP
jgi:hypothetical protein